VQQSAFDKLVDFYGLQGVQKVYAMFVGTLGVTGAADALNRAASQLGNTSAQELEAVLASVDTGASTD
jgi:hydroxymethylglutaryl-CoA reductase|tara:strand:- start:1344 stop:1547 length:204 start_codon:yes stop_codon:yes gene_type:complete